MRRVNSLLIFILFVLGKGILLASNTKAFLGLNSPIELAKKSDIPAQYVHPAAIQCNASTEIDSLKTSVSNGKSLIASAITDKGISTAATATFQTMANNIASISQGVSFTSPIIAVEAESDGIYSIIIPQNATKAYAVYGGGYYYGILRIDDANVDSFVFIRKSGFNRYDSYISYTALNRTLVINDSYPADLIFLICW